MDSEHWQVISDYIDHLLEKYKNEPYAIGITIRPLRERYDAGERSSDLLKDVLRTS